MSSEQTPDTNQKKTEESSGFLSNFKTTGVKNIEAAYTRAGATNNHTPGHASQLGSQDQTTGAKHEQGIGSQSFSNGFSDQKAEVFCTL